MSDLKQRVSDTTLDMLKAWDGAGAVDVPNFQLRYLRNLAKRTHGTAESFWILHEAERFLDCHNLARSLYESVIVSWYVRTSPERAAERIAFEIEGELKARESMVKLDNSLAVRFKERITKLKEGQAKLLQVAGVPKAKKVDIFQMSVDAGMELAYRGMYWRLCTFTHPDYSSSAEDNGDMDRAALRYVALAAPLMTAGNFFELIAKGVTAVEFNRHVTACSALLKEINLPNELENEASP